MGRAGVIFDLDDTLVDTALLRPFRDRRDWSGAKRSVARSTLYEGIAATLNELAANGVPFALVTNSPSNYAENVLQHHGIRIPNRVCFHDSSVRKPHPRPVVLAMEKAGIDVEGSIGVGDSMDDCSAYRAAGLVSLGAGWSSALDRGAQWNEIIQAPLQLLEWVK